MVEQQPRKYISYRQLDWLGFKNYVFGKYRLNSAKQYFRYAQQYSGLLENPSMLETMSRSKKNNVRKALVALSKYLGIYKEFKNKAENYGIKWSRSTSIDAFFRIINTNTSSDILEWYKETTESLNKDSSIYLKFALLSGLRASEAIDSFNLTVSLCGKDTINNYYNEELETLEHFRFPKVFFRNTKNVFITMIPRNLITEIADCRATTYSTIKMKLQRKGIPIRINELRDFYGTFMVRHGLIKEEVDLLQGRIGKSIFVRHYFSPAIKELRDRVFKALNELEQKLLS